MNRAVVILLMAAYCLPSPYAILWPDAVRDISASLALVRGEAIALSGPPVNYGPHLGPAWIWLQAVPLLGFSSLVAVSVWVALLASLKFLLLYELGRRLSGPRLGLCFALAAAFPSTALFQWTVFFHPNVVETAIAASLLLMAVADKRQSLLVLLAAAATLGLAAQLHITALFYLPLLPWVLYRIGARGSRFALGLGGIAAGIAIWFAPLLFASAADRGTLAAQGNLFALAWQQFSLETAGTVLRNAYLELPLAAGETYGAAAGVPILFWNAGLVLVAFAAVAGLVLILRVRGRERTVFGALAAALAVAWLAAVAIRHFTSFYLVYFVLPLSSIVLGSALHAALGSPRNAVRGLTWGALGFLGFSLAASAIGARNVGEDGFIESRVPPLGALSAPSSSVVRGGFSSALARDGFARRACALGEPTVTIHGEIAYSLAASTNLDMRLHCPGTATTLLVAGGDPGRHVTAIPVAAARALKIAGCDSDEGLCLVSMVDAIYPAHGRPIERDWYYFEQLRDRGPVEKVSLHFAATPGAHVAIYRYKPFEARWKLLSVTLDGHAMNPSFATYNSELYETAPSVSAGASWTIEFETDAPQWVDVHQFGKGA